MVQQLATGAMLTATQVARQWKLNVDSANHHCKMLLKGGVVSARRGNTGVSIRTEQFVERWLAEHALSA